MLPDVTPTLLPIVPPQPPLSSSSSLYLQADTVCLSVCPPLHMSLTDKSDEDISKLLAEHGIKHGPIVESTRKLYEKKLEKAMKSAPVNASSDKTYYREEEEEITYITYQSPVRQESYGDMLKRRGNVEPGEEEESDQDAEPPIQLTNRTANHNAVQSREPVRKSGGCMWKMIRLLLLLAVLAAVLYYAYCHVINEDNPFGIQ